MTAAIHNYHDLNPGVYDYTEYKFDDQKVTDENIFDVMIIRLVSKETDKAIEYNGCLIAGNERRIERVKR
jgi:hypothetical protein